MALPLWTATWCLLVVSVFVRYSYRYRRYLHSFPTRRSSDLVSSVSRPRLTPGPDAPPRCPWGAGIDRDRTPQRAPRRRSEEHTSELQSHSDLVCRLLLEKKNKVEKHIEGILNETTGVQTNST